MDFDKRLEDILYSDNHTPILNPSGREIGVQVTDYDMVEVKKALRELFLEVVGEAPTPKYWQEDVVMISDESKEIFYQRRMGRDELIAELREVIRGGE